MKKSLLLALALLASPAIIPAQSAPFELDLEEVTWPDLPALHSFAFAEWEGKWVLMCGRTNGLHGFFAATGFPVSSANAHIWVMDPQTQQIWDWDISGFPNVIKGPLLSTNPQYAQTASGQHLLIAGGYGKDPASENFITWNTLLAVDLAALVPAIINGGNPLAAFQVLNDERMQVCGGEMLRLGEYFYLVGGHRFEGLYSSNALPTFTQAYTTEIRKFKVAIEDNGLQILDYEAFSDPEFHRRDGNLTPFLSPTGEPGLAVYGGVFKPEKDLPFQHPIYISEGGSYEVDTDYFQKMSQYTCPVVPLFDSEGGHMHNVFFGGISLHYKDDDFQLIVPDSAMPFIDDFTVLSRYANGETQEVILSQEFDELLGANAKFILSLEAPHYENKVLKLNELQERTMVGCIYGGIKAAIPNLTPSVGSNRLFKVFIKSNLPSASAENVVEDLPFYAFPNPFSGGTALRLPEGFQPSELFIHDVSGAKLAAYRGGEALSEAEVWLGTAGKGIYFIEVSNGSKTGRLKIVKI